MAERTVPELTDRERDVVQLLATGAENQEIADNLGMRLDTVKSHIRRINNRWSTSGRVQIVVTAIAIGEVDVSNVATADTWWDVQLRKLRSVLDLPPSTEDRRTQVAEVIGAAHALRSLAAGQVGVGFRTHLGLAGPACAVAGGECRG